MYYVTVQHACYLTTRVVCLYLCLCLSVCLSLSFSVYLFLSTHTHTHIYIYIYIYIYTIHSLSILKHIHLLNWKTLLLSLLFCFSAEYFGYIFICFLLVHFLSFPIICNSFPLSYYYLLIFIYPQLWLYFYHHPFPHQNLEIWNMFVINPVLYCTRAKSKHAHTHTHTHTHPHTHTHTHTHTHIYIYIFWQIHPTKHYCIVWNEPAQALASMSMHTKTEYTCFNQTGDISTLDGTSLKLVDKFTYRGSSVSSTETRS